MVRALKICAVLFGVAAMLTQTADAHAAYQNSVTASTTVGYVVPVGSTFGVSLRVECTTTPCVGYQYQLGYNPRDGTGRFHAASQT